MKEQNQNNYKKIELMVDMDKQDTTWEKYGHITAPLVIRDRFGNMTSNQSKFKVWFQNQDFKNFLPSKYPIYPNEELDENINQIINNELKAHNFYVKDKIGMHHGDTSYWTVLSNETFDVDKDDKIKLGVVVRNGIGTNVALGVDLYTYRLTCSNGAVARGKNLGTFSIQHVGNFERMKKVFEDSIMLAFNSVKELLKYYRKSTRIRVNDEIANKMFKRLSSLGETYLPSTWNIPKKEEIQELKKKDEFEARDNLVKVMPTVDGEKPTLWQTFNDITAKQRDRMGSKKIGFTGVAWQQNLLHKSMIEVVNNAERRATRSS
jgi:hypothetical protein